MKTRFTTRSHGCHCHGNPVRRCRHSRSAPADNNTSRSASSPSESPLSGLDLPTTNSQRQIDVMIGKQESTYSHLESPRIAPNPTFLHPQSLTMIAPLAPRFCLGVRYISATYISSQIVPVRCFLALTPKIASFCRASIILSKISVLINPTATRFIRTGC